MTENNDFQPVGRVTVDSRRRVPLGQADAVPSLQYSLWQHGDGSILLRPLTSPIKKEIPAMTSADPTLVDLDRDLAAAIAAGDDATVCALADKFEARGFSELAGVLRAKGVTGVRQNLEVFGI